MREVRQAMSFIACKFLEGGSFSLPDTRSGGVGQSFCCVALRLPVTLPAHVSFSVFSARGARRFAHRFHFLRAPSPGRNARAAKGTSSPARAEGGRSRSGGADAACFVHAGGLFPEAAALTRSEPRSNETQRHGQIQIRPHAAE